jgi:mutual gliding-motility protein MglA
VSLINPNSKEIHCKIVYYGPSLGGKTTNVQWIYKTTHQEQGGKMMEFGEGNERTVLYDFLPLSVGKIRDLTARFHLYSVPGQIAYDPYRKLILKGIDGVVFVADSQVDRMEENLVSLKNLETNLKQQGYDINEIPLVVQYNKRDLPSIAPISEMRAHLNTYNSPDFEAVASQGIGVFESFKTVSKLIITILKGGKT